MPDENAQRADGLYKDLVEFAADMKRCYELTTGLNDHIKTMGAKYDHWPLWEPIFGEFDMDDFEDKLDEFIGRPEPKTNVQQITKKEETKANGTN